MEFEQIVKERYAVKLFNGKKVPAAKFAQLQELIRFSATSFNLQPYVVKVVTDAEVLKKLEAASWGQKQITSCSHLLVFCADTDVENNVNRLEKLMIKNGAKKEDIKGYVDMMMNFAKGKTLEEKKIWAQRQVYLALGNALNGAKALGFDSCPMEGFDPVEYAKILKLPKNLVPTVICPIGYAADTPRPKVRFPKEEIFI